MAGLTEDQFLGRRIEKIFVTAPFTPSGNVNIYTVGTSPWIAPSNAEFLQFLSVSVVQGAEGSGTVSFGTSSGGTDWSASQSLSNFSDNPAVFFPTNTPASRPVVYGAGTPIWAGFGGSFSGTPLVVITGYGWVY